jgi:hypothetical protein
MPLSRGWGWAGKREYMNEWSKQTHPRTGGRTNAGLGGKYFEEWRFSRFGTALAWFGTDPCGSG